MVTKKDVEIYLPKFKIGDLVNIIGDKSNEMKVIGFELSGYVSPNRNDLVYKLIVLGNDYPNVIEHFIESDIEESRNNKIESILKK